jgi:hypothetical protein
MIRSIRPALFAAALLACVPAIPAHAQIGEGVSTRDRAPHRTRGAIQQDELESVNVQDLYAAIRRLRPGWLRGGSGPSCTKVILGSTPIGTTDDLSQMSPSDVAKVEMYSPAAAMARYGPDYTCGVIVLTSRQ